MSLPVAHVGATLAPLELLPLLVVAVLYARRAVTLAERGRAVPLWRQACFAAGLTMIVVAIASPVGHIADELIIGHMVEHLMIGDLAPLLLVLGLTRPLLQPILALPVLGRLQILAHPLVSFPLWAANLFFWHVPALYDAAYADAPVHALEHTSFIFFGVLMWMSVFGPLPKPAWFTAAWKVGYVIAVRFTGAILGNVLMWSGDVLYDEYTAGQAYWGIEPLTDQSTAGVVMMLEGTFVALGVLAWVFFEAAREGIEKQRLLDLAHDRGVELDAERAQRAVAAGHGARLERQLIASGRDPDQAG